MAVNKFKVSGMVCDGCVDTITKLVSEIDGVNSINLQLKTSEAIVDYSNDRVTADKVHQAVKDAGFGVTETMQASA